jgi:hypothetical protein
MYFADLAREAGTHDLSFVGQMPLYLNVPDLALPPGVKEIARTARDRVALESLKDLATNELFRSDVYVRGPYRPEIQEARRFFEETRFGALTTEDHIKREVRLPVYTLDFKSQVYSALIPRLCEAPVTAVELARRPELAGLGQARLGQCIQNLCLGGQIVPMRPPSAAPSPAARYRMPSAFNRAVLDQGIAGEGPLVLASPATGTGLTVSLLEAVFLRLLTDVEPESHASWLRGFVEMRPFPLVLGDKRIDDAEDLVAMAARDLDERRRRMGPKLCQLGILEPAA